MGFLDKLNLPGKKKAAANADHDHELDADVPNMEDAAASASLADTMQAQQPRRPKIDFRGQDHQADDAEVESHGVPSVNRRTGSNKLVTGIGFVLILGVAGAGIYASNSPKKPVAKKASQEEKVSNTLPPIAMPDAPPPIDTSSAAGPIPLGHMPTSAGPGQVPQGSGAAPIPLQTGGGRQMPGAGAPAGKAEPTWWERKAGGNLLVSSSLGAGGGGAPRGGDIQPAGLASPSQYGGMTPTGGPAAGNDNAFAAKLEPTITRAVSASLLPDRNFLITKGTSLDCAMETAIDSSVPGMTTCRITQDIYSDNGQVLLLDRGSQLVGEYQSGLKSGQVRLFVLWTRVKTPNGVVVALNSPGTDALGRSGLDGWVDNHFAERFGAAILMSLLKDTVGSISSRGGGSGTNNYYGNTADAGGKVIEKILDSTVNIPPTIVKNQGDHIQVMVARDLDFSGVYSLAMKGAQ